MHRTLLTATTALCGLATAVVADTDRGAVLTTYADIAAAAYADSLATAQELQAAVEALIAELPEKSAAPAGPPGGDMYGGGGGGMGGMM